MGGVAEYSRRPFDPSEEIGNTLGENKMKVAVLSPTTAQQVEKFAVLFPEGVDLVGPQADDRHYWANAQMRLEQWKTLGLKVSIREEPFEALDFSGYDLLIQSAEAFWFAKDWAKHCLRVDCPILLKACWANTPIGFFPYEYIEKVRDFPVLLEMPAHVRNWTRAGFRDVNFIPNPVGEWWFAREWSGEKEQVLFVLSGKDSWRPADLSSLGVDWWEELCKRFPGRTHHHDGHVSYRTPLQMAELFGQSRVFVNFDRPHGFGERPLTLAFTEALSAGLPVAARDLPGLSYRQFIDSNGICCNDFEAICSFVDRCLTDKNFAAQCSARSREIARLAFSYSSLRPKYDVLISRAQRAFAEQRQRRERSFSFPGSNLPLRFRVAALTLALDKAPRFRNAVLQKTLALRTALGLRRQTLHKIRGLPKNT
jgi:hypothetical protein